MARIYISYRHDDREFAAEVAAFLKSLSHEIAIDIDSLAPGQEWRSALETGLKTSEVFVVLLTERSLESQYVLSEIGAARAYAENSDRMLLVPVVLDGIEIPPIVRDIQAIYSPHRDADYVCKEIDRAVSAFVGRRVAAEERAGEVREKIERNAAEYIDEAIGSLTILERRNRLTGTAWYIVGFVALVIGVGFTLYSMSRGLSSVEPTVLHFAQVALKSIIVIGLLGACSKYSFSLGKSYVSEALKSSDRLHAIAFGKFYLRVYGATAQWQELREVFAQWNIDRASTFASLDTSQFDPKIIESLVELARIVAGRQGDKK